ncbi:hypothetical protein C4566_03155 [Candidatus Parcubacteria bacterium]|nr:MAG: hypothetical protein C4566_03155 [Candidatus Parcubacteria bacterium]
MNLEKLLNLSYLFHRYPPGGFSWPLRIVLIVVFGGAIAWGVYSGLKNKKVSGYGKKLWYKLQIWGWTSGLVGFLLFYFREVRALYLSARAYLLIWLIIMLVWLVLIIILHKKRTPDKEVLIKKKEEYEKWLPQARK